MRMRKINSWASWAKMTNPAAWWGQSPTQYSCACTDFASRRWSWWIDATGMGGHSRLLLWNRSEVGNDWFEGSGSHQTANGPSCIRTCSNTIWRAYGDPWYHPWNIANATMDFSARMQSHEGRFQEATVKQTHRVSFTQCKAWFVTNYEVKPVEQVSFYPCIVPPQLFII